MGDLRVCLRASRVRIVLEEVSQRPKFLTPTALPSLQSPSQTNLFSPNHFSTLPPATTPPCLPRRWRKKGLRRRSRSGAYCPERGTNLQEKQLTFFLSTLLTDPFLLLFSLLVLSTNPRNLPATPHHCHPPPPTILLHCSNM